MALKRVNITLGQTEDMEHVFLWCQFASAIFYHHESEILECNENPQVQPAQNRDMVNKA